jgi:hypothetical protein
MMREEPDMTDPGATLPAHAAEDTGEYGLPVVGVELDSGPTDMAFGYVPVGVPAYSDVAPELWPQPSHAAAELVGARMLVIGNWQSFRIEKRWWPAAEWLGGDSGHLGRDVPGDNDE